MSDKPKPAIGDDRAMVLTPEHWPQRPFLPVKRYKKGNHEGPELGVLCEHDSLKVLLTNLFMFDPFAKFITYQSVDELLKDGWIVD